ncbi:hypothetical protein F5148DRAFT_1366063 [Russula earlei]|uniref:Uncharacterized protein n=1 Tax=Russula earlei TaxID=71964 RepID=A0ACC0UIQ5_9AGAM|nr:hypothetical protein F5148DRAFT_1366063 [Russula earlei]
MSLSKIFGAPSPAEAALSPAKAACVPSESSAANLLRSFYHPDITAQSGQWKEELLQHTESYGQALTCTIKARPGHSSTCDPETPSCKKGIFTKPSDRGSHPVLPSSDEQVALSDKVDHRYLSWSQVGKLWSGARNCCRHHFSRDMGPRAPNTIGHRMPASMSKDCDRSESTILPPKKSTTEQQELEMLNHTQMTNLL